MEKESFISIYFSFSPFAFCFRKKNVLVNDDKKGSSEKHYQGDQAKWLARQGTVGNLADNLRSKVRTENMTAQTAENIVYNKSLFSLLITNFFVRGAAQYSDFPLSWITIARFPTRVSFISSPSLCRLNVVLTQSQNRCMRGPLEEKK
jgi:hypothetical protein